MIATKDILYSITKTIDNNFTEDVIIDSSNQQVDEEGNITYNSCFYVQLIPSIIKASTRTTNAKTMLVSIKYYPFEKCNNIALYDISDKLQQIYSRIIKVKDRVFTISSIEPNILNDEIGNMLDFLITFTYHDDVYIESEACDVMRNIQVRYNINNSKKKSYFIALADGELIEVDTDTYLTN